MSYIEENKDRKEEKVLNLLNNAGEKYLSSLMGPRWDMVKKRIQEVKDRMGRGISPIKVHLLYTNEGKLLFFPPPNPFLLPFSSSEKTDYKTIIDSTLQIKTQKDERGCFYRIDGGLPAGGEGGEVEIEEGHFIRMIRKEENWKAYSYLFIFPEEILIPLILSSADPILPSTFYPEVKGALYYRMGNHAFLLSLTIQSQAGSPTLFTEILKETGFLYENLLRSGNVEGGVKRFLQDTVNSIIFKTLGLLSIQINKTDCYRKVEGERLADKLARLRMEGVVDSIDMGRWVGLLNNLKDDLLLSLSKTKWPEELSSFMNVLKKSVNNPSLKSSITFLKTLKGTPQYLSLMDLKLEKLLFKKGRIVYSADPLYNILRRPKIFLLPPPAYLSNFINSISRLCLVSFRREMGKTLKRGVEKAHSLYTARFLLSSTPGITKELLKVKNSSSIFHLKASSLHGYISENMLGYTEGYVLNWLYDYYRKRGTKISVNMIRKILYLFAIIKGIEDLLNHIKDKDTPTPYVYDLSLVLMRNINKYEAIYKQVKKV